MIHELEGGLIVFGIVATLFPLAWAVALWKQRGIGRVMSYMLLGETVCMAITLWFAISSFIGTWSSMTPTELMLLRLVGFVTAFASTVRLVFYLRSLQRRSNG